MYYKKIANNMPRVILTSRDHLVPVKKYKYFLWVGLALNSVGPIGESFFLYEYLKDYHETKTLDPIYYTASIVCTYCVYAGQLVSGIQMINAVRHIRRYLRLSAQKEQLSKKAQYLHYASFGTYLVSVVILMIAVTVYLGFPTSAFAFNFYMCSNIVWESSAFLSQMLMVVIFWFLSTPEKPRK